MKYIITLISIILLITTILGKDLHAFKSKKSLQNIRNLNEDEDDTDNSQSYEETDEIESNENSESIESSESQGIEDTTISWADNGDGNSTAPLDPEENDKAFVVVYAIDNYRYRYSTIIFSLYVFFHNVENNYDIITLTVNIVYNLRVLEETTETITCRKGDGDGELYRYNCSKEFSGDIKNIECTDLKAEGNSSIFFDNTTSSAEELKDIGNQTMQRISEKGFVYIKNCEYIRRDSVIQIRGESENNLNDRSLLILDVRNTNGDFFKVDSDLILNEKRRLLRKLEDKDVIIQINPSQYINTDLNKTAGVLDDGRNALIHFKKNIDSDLYYSPDHNNYFKNTNKKGLSGGAITALVITLAAVIIAIIAITFIMLKRPPIPPKQYIGNSDPRFDMSSSTNVIN
jgi:hypothetical protein